MKKHFFALTLALGAAAAAAGCIGFDHTSTVTAPTSTNGGASALMGMWTSASTGIIPPASSCTNFKWNATEQTGTSAKGTFSATCAGNLNVNGTAQGTLSGTSVNWSATATASTPSIASCAVALQGTAELGVDSIRVPYSGTPCLGPVSGVEVLQRH